MMKHCWNSLLSLRIAGLILFVAVIATGCSYEVTARNSQALEGENEDWSAEYKINFVADYFQKDGKIYPKSMDQNEITVTYKKDISALSDVKHLEISYEDSFGSGGRLTEDFDSPPTEKQFRLGGGGGSGGSSWSDTDSHGYPGDPEHLHSTIMIFSGPSVEMRKNAAVTVKIQVDGKTDTIQLLPVEGPDPISAIFEQIHNKLTKQPFLKTFSGRASDLSLKLEDYNVSIVTDKAISGSTMVVEGDKEGQELVPTVLYYEFTIKNEGRKTLIGSLNDFQVKIVPSSSLENVSKETVGENIFDPDSGFGCGESMGSNIFNHGDCKVELSFNLSTESTENTLITPSKEKLEKLLDNASDASLIVIYKGEEAARFDLSKE